MPTYQYRCRKCNQLYEEWAERDQKTELDDAVFLRGCVLCDGPVRPSYNTVRFGSVMHEHYSPATGTIVSDPRQFDRDVRRLEEEATIRDGIPTTFSQVDLSDREALGVTDEGLKSTHDRQVETGRREPTPRLL